MKIAELRIQNLRGYKDQTIVFNDYTCLVGPNGAGKSTILCALCIFFRDTEHFVTNLHSLTKEDFHKADVVEPIKITATFKDLSEEAKADFKEYVRHNRLVITSEASFDATTRTADVRQYGQRLVLRDFRSYFAAEGDGKPVAYLKDLYQKIRATFQDLPDVSVKNRMTEALRAYECANPDKCELLPSSDQFYGFSSGINRLAKYIQWVFIPAVKDASTEQTETKSSALGKLLARSVRTRVNFSDQLAEIRKEAASKYSKLIEENQDVLQGLATALETRLQDYAHTDTSIRLQWLSVPDRAIRIDEPVAQIIAGEEGFSGELSRFGHGLQRCYILALLQELTASGHAVGPRLILGCDEPELHQHPPQARHLSDVLTRLSDSDTQVIVSTHSPHLVSGDRFADIRLVRKDANSRCAMINQVSIEDLAKTLAHARQENVAIPTAATLKLHQALLPSLNEIFFTRVVILVEGPEDVAYIATYATLLGLWEQFRRKGCHLIAVERKSKMLHPLAITRHLRIPTFVIFDSDGHVARGDHRAMHEKDNSAILRVRGYDSQPPLPGSTFWAKDTVMWSSEIGCIVKSEFGQESKAILESLRSTFGHEGGLEKNALFVSDFVTASWEAGLRSATLEKLIDSILDYAKQPWPEGYRSLLSLYHTLATANGQLCADYVE